MAPSLKKRISLLSPESRAAWFAQQPDWVLREIAREEWWWVARPEQIPPEVGGWMITLFLAGRGCIAPWTRIYLPGRDEWARVDELAALGEPVEVLAMTPDGPRPAMTDGAPFLKGYAQLWRITLEDGSVITVTDQHRFLTTEGWTRCADVRVGHSVAAGPHAPAGTCKWGDVGIHWVPVLAVEPAGFGPFYDLTVPGAENYLAEGVWNHNSGKSRSGAEWIVDRVVRHPFDKHGAPTEHLLIAKTLSDARLVCVEGPAGVLRVLDRRQIKYNYIKSPKPMVVFPDGAKIMCQGAENADVGRGFNASSCWLDEICAWHDSYGSWYEGLLPALRADLYGDHPRAFCTTTPKPIKLLMEWVKRDDGTVHLITGSTFDNQENLSAPAIAELRRRYDGTAIGRQELYGEILEAFEGALFARRHINNHRITDIPDGLVYTIVGVDPSLTGEDDEMGVVVVGRDRTNHMYVLADRSDLSAGREAALHAWRTVAEFGADLLVYEANLGKRWMEQVFRDAYMELVGQGLFPEGTTPPMKGVDSKHGKKTRAEPVAMRYEQGRVSHVGEFPILEAQMIGYIPDESRDSPDRMDALVHACRHHMTAEKKQVRLASPVDTVLRDLWTPDSYLVG